MRSIRLLGVPALLLILGSWAHADFVAPKQSILGAETPIPLGELVTLSVSDPGKVDNLASTSYEWTIFDGTTEKKIARDADGKVFFGAGLKARKLLAVVAVTHLFVVKDDDKVKQIATKTLVLNAAVTIGEDAPPAPPAPGPAPPPPDAEPTFAEGKYGLSKAAWDWARTTVAAPGRGASAGALAASFRAVAAQASLLKTPEAILKATIVGNNKALAGNVKAWAGFLDQLQEKLFSLSEQGKLATPDDYSTAWVELASGLEKVR